VCATRETLPVAVLALNLKILGAPITSGTPIVTKRARAQLITRSLVAQPSVPPHFYLNQFRSDQT